MRGPIVIACGGTGGHLYPARALAEALTTKGRSCHFMGGKLASNPYLATHRDFWSDIPCALPSWKNPASYWNIFKGVTESFQLLKKLNPPLVVGFGSYHSFPVLLAAFLRRIPIMLWEGNAWPGRVNRLLASKALTTALCFPVSAKSLKGHTTLASPPLKYRQTACSHSEALAYYGLDSSCPTILIFGGSQGAQSINNYISNIPPNAWPKPVQLIHLAGTEIQSQRLITYYLSAGIKAVVKPFETAMHYAWRAADLACCRSGAATLCEAIEFEVPLIMIPYPFAAEGHQICNAHVFQDLQAGIAIQEDKCDSERLVESIKSFLPSTNRFLKAKEVLKIFNTDFQQRFSLDAIVLQLLRDL